jgi:hypothetical protein
MDSYLEMQKSLLNCGTSSKAPSLVGASTDAPVVNELKATVNRWSELDSNIKRAYRTIAGWKHTKLELEEKIIAFMTTNDVEGLNTQDSLIECKKTVRRVRTGKVDVSKTIETLVSDPEARAKILAAVYGTTPGTTERVHLKRVIF